MVAGCSLSFRRKSRRKIPLGCVSLLSFLFSFAEGDPERRQVRWTLDLWYGNGQRKSERGSPLACLILCLSLLVPLLGGDGGGVSMDDLAESWTGRMS